MSLAEADNITRGILNKLQEVKEELLNGLCTDGGHHKQYSLEQVFTLLFGEEALEEERWHVEEDGSKWERWESGIPG
jgi:hypothetical protein